MSVPAWERAATAAQGTADVLFQPHRLCRKGPAQGTAMPFPFGVCLG